MYNVYQTATRLFQNPDLQLHLGEVVISLVVVSAQISQLAAAVVHVEQG